MELRQLKYFLRIAELGNMTRAAESLHIAQPSLSQQMRNLEQDLGVQLLHRSASGMRVTEAGAVMRAQAQRILRQIDETRVMVRAEQASPAGEVTLGLPGSTARILAIPLLNQLHASFPGVRLKFVEAPSERLLALLAAADIDLAVAVDPGPDAMLETTPLVVEQLHLVQQPLAAVPGTGAATAGSLAGLSLVLPARPNSIRATVDAVAQRAGVEYHLASEINPVGLIVQAVLFGMGATVLPWAAVSEEVRSGRLVATPLAGYGAERRLAICVAQRPPTTAAMRIVHGLIVDAVAHLIDSQAWQGARVASHAPRPALNSH